MSGPINPFLHNQSFNGTPPVNVANIMSSQPRFGQTTGPAMGPTGSPNPLSGPMDPFSQNSTRGPTMGQMGPAGGIDMNSKQPMDPNGFGRLPGPDPGQLMPNGPLMPDQGQHGYNSLPAGFMPSTLSPQFLAQVRAMISQRSGGPWTTPQPGAMPQGYNNWQPQRGM